jgi:hypothetical protein
MAVSAAQVVSGVNGFNNCLTVSVTTGQTTLGASDFVLIMHQIEGWRVARLRWGTAAAQPMTIAFWSIHHRTGLYSVQVQNGANNRSYVFTYTHNAADGFQYNVATIPGCTDGAWATDNAVSINICFTLAAGATYTASAANTWLTGNFMAAPGQVNGVAAATDVFRITGVTVLPGIEAPSAARSAFIMRPYDQELVTCKRYWERLAIYLSVYSTSGTGVAASGFFSVEKRVSPTLVFNNVASSNWTSSASYPDTRRVISVGSSPATGGCVIDVAYTCDARL